MYKIIEPQTIGRFDFGDRYARVAHAAWYPVNGRPLRWREGFYGSFLAAMEYSRNAFRLIEFHNECEETVIDCGIVAILPLKPETAKSHINGSLSQYRLKGEDLFVLHPLRKEKSYHYIQSVFLHANHVRSVTALKLVHEAIWDILKRQGCGYRQRPFSVYCEPQLPPGQRLAMGQGLRDLGVKSPDGMEIFGFDSTVHTDQLVARRIKDLW